MIDFPLIPEASPKFAWVISGIMYFVILLFNMRWGFSYPSLRKIPPKKPTLTFLVLVYCITAIYCGDWLHYQELVRGKVGGEFIPGMSLEYIYVWLINVFDGNYFLFRTIVWGIGLKFLMLSFKNANLDPYRCLFFLFVIYITDYAYSRAAVAMAVFYFGFVMLFKRNEKNSMLYVIIGIAFILMSTAFHRTMFVLVALTPLAFIPINKKTLLLAVGGIVVVGVFWKIIFDSALGMVMESDELGYRTTSYESLSGSTSISFDLNGIFFLWYKTVVHLPFWLCVIKIFKGVMKGTVPLIIQAVFRISILLYIFSLMMLMIYGSTSPFYYRYEGMLFIPITIMAGYLFQNRLIKKQRYVQVVGVCALSLIKDFVYRIFWL